MKIILPEDYIAPAHPDDVDSVRGEYMNHMFQGIDKNIILTYRSKTKWNDDGRTLLVTEMQVERDREGRVLHYTGITINNTKCEKMILELKMLKEKAELWDRLKSAFLANMSHEVRTYTVECHCRFFPVVAKLRGSGGDGKIGENYPVQ